MTPNQSMLPRTVTRWDKCETNQREPSTNSRRREPNVKEETGEKAQSGKNAIYIEEWRTQKRAENLEQTKPRYRLVKSE